MTQYQDSKLRLVPLDGLRGFAALIVFVGHFSSLTKIWNEALGGGSAQLGVMIFFLLSGFLMGYLYLPREVTNRSILTFLRRRFARVYPLFAFIVLLSLAMAQLTDDWRLLPYQIKSVRYTVQNLSMYSGESVMWTTVTELRFYLFFPLIWLVFARSRAATIILIIALIIGCFLYSWHVRATGAPPPPRIISTLYMGLTIYTGSYFLVGILIAMFHKHLDVIKARVWNVGFVLSLILFFMLYPSVSPFVGAWQGPDVPAGVFSLFWLNPICLIITALLLVTTLKASCAGFLLGNGVMRFFGKISYSFYLWHMPVMWYFNRLTDITETPYLFFIVAFPIIVLVSTISYYCIEDPARRLLNGRRERNDDKAKRQGAHG